MEQQKQDESSHLNLEVVITDYFTKQLNGIEFILSKPHHQISEEDIHKLRVAIKRIKSLAELIHFCIPAFKRKKFVARYNKIFSSAGKVRELQLEISMLKKLQLSGTLKNYYRWLKKELKKKKRFFFSFANAAMVARLQKKSQIMLPFFDVVFYHELNSFFEEKSNETRRLMETNPLKKKEVHKLRKILKEFYYSLSIFGAKNDQIKKIDNIQELLGEWHNNVVLQGYLQKAVHSGHLDHKEKKIIALVKDKISTQTRVLFEKVKAMQQTFDTSLLKFTLTENN